jgi:hypothetical protein
MERTPDGSHGGATGFQPPVRASQGSVTPSAACCHLDIVADISPCVNGSLSIA